MSSEYRPGDSRGPVATHTVVPATSGATLNKDLTPDMVNAMPHNYFTNTQPLVPWATDEAFRRQYEAEVNRQRARALDIARFSASMPPVSSLHQMTARRIPPVPPLNALEYLERDSSDDMDHRETVKREPMEHSDVQSEVCTAARQNSFEREVHSRSEGFSPHVWRNSSSNYHARKFLNLPNAFPTTLSQSHFPVTTSPSYSIPMKQTSISIPLTDSLFSTTAANVMSSKPVFPQTSTNLSDILLPLHSTVSISKAQAETSGYSVQTPHEPYLQKVLGGEAHEADTNGSIQVKKESDLCNPVEDYRNVAEKEKDGLNEQVSIDSEDSNDSSNRDGDFDMQPNGSYNVSENKLTEKHILSCSLCDFETDENQAYEHHVKSIHPTVCFGCKFVAEDIQQLVEHRQVCPESNAKQSSPPAKQKKSKKLLCKVCQNIAENEEDFYTHRRTHISADKVLCCTFCPFVTQYKHHLDYHMKNHTGNKPFKCQKCDYSCVNKSMLNSHMKSHSNFYSYRCKDCNYEAKYMHALKCHCRKYKHAAMPVLNPDGSLNPYPIVDIYGTRRGPKIKRDSEGNPIYPAHYTAKIAMQPTTSDSSGSPLATTSLSTNAAISPPNAFSLANSQFFRHHETPTGPPTFSSFPPFDLRIFGANSALFNTPPSISTHCPSYLNSPQSPLTINSSKVVETLARALPFTSKQDSSLSLEQMTNSHVCPRCSASFPLDDHLQKHILLSHILPMNAYNSEIETPPRAPLVPSRRSEENGKPDILSKLLAAQIVANPLLAGNSLQTLLQYQAQSVESPVTSSTQPFNRSENDSSPTPLDLTKDHTPPQQIMRRGRLSDSPVDVSPSSLTPPDTCSPPKKARRSDHQLTANRRLDEIHEEQEEDHSHASTLYNPTDKSVAAAQACFKQDLDDDVTMESSTPTESSRSVLECSFCKITFCFRDMYSKHIAFHESENPLMCSFCKETLPNFSEFYDHCYCCKNRQSSSKF